MTLDARLADVATWGWPEGAFEVVVAIFIQFADKALRAILFDRMKAALTPGGLLIMQGYRPEQVNYGTGGPPQRENMYTRDLLVEAFAEFDILHLEEHEFGDIRRQRARRPLCADRPCGAATGSLIRIQRQSLITGSRA